MASPASTSTTAAAAAMRALTRPRLISPLSGPTPWATLTTLTATTSLPSIIASSAHTPSRLRPQPQHPQHRQQLRHSSHSPLGSPVAARKKVTIPTLTKMAARGEPITMITAHDFPSAHVADHAGIDMVLVGDSLAMVALGMEDTSEVLLEEMILHCRSVSRGARNAFTVGDLPMGSYEISPSQALGSAIRVIKEGRMQAIKLEGGLSMAPTISRIAAAGIPVLAHVGLTPQRQNALGGFRVQGKSAAGALEVLRDALAVQDAGAFAVVLEAVPAEVAALVTRKLRVPTIGIGAGAGCAGQVLVQVDMAGNFPPGRFLPKFVKKYGDVWGESMRAIEAYRDEVKARVYPEPQHTYPMPPEEFAEFERIVEKDTPEALSAATETTN